MRIGYAGRVAIDEALAARVRTLLSTRTDLEEKRMMGRLAFLVDGTMCCTVGTDGLLVRVTPADREKWLTLPHVQPMTMGARTMTGFVRVEHAGLRTAAALRTWVTRGLAAATAA